MRQEDTFEDFDLEVRKLLENAEERVPSGIWEVVSSHLGVETGSGRRAWGWAAAAVAAAACLALLLIVPLNRTEDGVGNREVTLARLVTEPDAALIGTVGIVPAPVPATFPEKKVVHRIKADADTCGGFKPAALLTEAGEPVAESRDTVMNVAAESSSADESDKTLLAFGGWDYGYDADELDEEMQGLSFGIEGSMNVNDSRFFSGMDARAHMTSGQSTHVETTIEEESVSVYDIPLSFGLNLRYQFAPKLSIGSGVSYSLLGRTFSGTCYEFDGGLPVRTLSGDIRHSMHYLGIPLNLYFDFVQTKAVSCYVHGGGTAEFCVLNKYSIEDFTLEDPVKSPQFSVGAGIGVQFRLSSLIGIYLDPGFRYYFRCDQPKSIRTDQPFMVNFEAGLRFNL